MNKLYITPRQTGFITNIGFLVAHQEDFQIEFWFNNGDFIPVKEKIELHEVYGVVVDGNEIDLNAVDNISAWEKNRRPQQGFGLAITQLIAAHLNYYGDMDYHEAEKIAQRIDDQIVTAKWLATRNGTTFDRSYDPKK